METYFHADVRADKGGTKMIEIRIFFPEEDMEEVGMHLRGDRCGTAERTWLIQETFI